MNEMRKLINIMENTTITEVPMSDFTDSLPGRSGRAGASGRGGAIGGTIGGVVGAYLQNMTWHLMGNIGLGDYDALGGINHTAAIGTEAPEMIADHLKVMLSKPNIINSFVWPAYMALFVGLGVYAGKKSGNALDSWRNRRRSDKRQDHALKTLGIEPLSQGGAQFHPEVKALAEKHAAELKMCASLIKQMGIKIASELGESTDIIEKQFLKITNQSSKNQQAETNPLEDLGSRTGRDIDTYIERADASFDQIASRAGMTPAQLGALWYLQGGQYESVEQSMLVNIGHELERLGKLSADFPDKLNKAYQRD